MDKSVPPEVIRLRGVRVHNLRNVNVDIPRNQLVAICGVSGSGKTSLALDTLYAEGQRRYIESFSAYTRQFLERLEKPDYDRIEGLPPALAVTRGSQPRGNRSAVGTASETLDYLRLCFANASTLVCYQCGQVVVPYSPQLAAALIERIGANHRLMVTYTVHWEDIGERAAVLADLQNEGFVRLLSAGQVVSLGQEDRERLASALPDQGEARVVVDRLRGGVSQERTTESLENAFEFGNGVVDLFIDQVDSGEFQLESFQYQGSTIAGPPVERSEIAGQGWGRVRLSVRRQCSHCDLEYPDPEPRLFSFNSPLGACSECEGFGDTTDLDLKLIVPDGSKSIAEGAIAPWSTPAYRHHLEHLQEVADDLNLPMDVPFRKLTKRQIRLLMDGSDAADFSGIRGFFKGLERKKYKMHVRVFLSRWRSYKRCAACLGARLSPQALAFRLGGKNLAELSEIEIVELQEFLGQLQLNERKREIVAEPLRQVRQRLTYLHSVGLGYLQLNRTLRTLSGGEAQRTALTAALGSNLVNMLYVLDEPSAGLHPHDVEQLAVAVERLTERGNTVVIVEHEDALLKRADTVIEVGPGAGARGGQIVYAGARQELGKSGTLTAKYLSGELKVPRPANLRVAKKKIVLRGCRGNNLQGVDVPFPLEVFCIVTGVSGSGKSSLVQDTLYGALANRLTASRLPTLPFDSVTGVGQIDACMLVDQSPVSRSPRSNPVTYVKAFDEIRSAFAETVEAKTRNLTAGHFSFNSDLGRCPQCSGDGVLQIDMQFLADVQVTCSECKGKRYRQEILNVRYRGQTIADVLQLTVHEAIGFFRGANKVQQKLKVLSDVGLDYVPLGQSASTLSSGESQRLKLAGHLAGAARKRTLFLLDEPTTGLHASDIVKLLDCFDALLAAGHSLVVVEHNVQLIAAADHVIDLGPGPASEGGRIVFAGTPEQLTREPGSITGRYLRPMFSSSG